MTQPRFEPRRPYDECLQMETLTCPDVVFRVMGSMGVEVDDLRSPFFCPLHGHEEDYPSAALFIGEDGEVLFHDMHKRDGIEFYTLPHLYAAWSTDRGVVRRNSNSGLGPDEEEVWWIRALIESDHLETPPQPPMRVEIPDDGSKGFGYAKKVYDGLCYRLQIEHFQKQCQFVPFSYRFAALWCSIGNNTCKGGRAWLLDHGYLEARHKEEVLFGKRIKVFGGHEPPVNLRDMLYGLAIPDDYTASHAGSSEA